MLRICAGSGASPMPEVCVSMCRSVILSPGPWNFSSGTWSASRSVSDSLPSSTSAMTDSAVIVFVIDPMRWRVDDVCGVSLSMSAKPKPSSNTRSSPDTTPTPMPGRWYSSSAACASVRTRSKSAFVSLVMVSHPPSGRSETCPYRNSSKQALDSSPSPPDLIPAPLGSE